MIILLNIHCFIAKRHMQTPKPELRSTSFNPSQLLPSFANALSKSDPNTGKPVVISRGQNPELSVQKMPKSLYFCAGMYNMSNNEQLIWLIVNINPNPSGNSVFQARNNFNDYGREAVGVRTHYQIKNDLKEGYLGPIKYQGNENNPQNKYKITITAVDVKSTSNQVDAALKQCASNNFAQITFISKAAHLLLATLLVVAYL